MMGPQSPANRLRRSQGHAENKLCDPSVVMEGKSYRPNKRPGAPKPEKSS